MFKKVCLVQAQAGGNSKRCARVRARIQRIDGVGFDFASWEQLRQHNVERLNSELSASTQSPGASAGELATPDPAVAQLILIAEFNVNKRHIPLLFELAQLRKLGYEFHLTLIGSGAAQAQTEAVAAELNLSQHITFAGQISHDEVMHYISKADIGLLVSEREGLPRSLMELIAGGVVIAGTPTRGIIEEVVDNRAIAPLSQSGEFAHMLASLIDCPAFRSELHAMQYEHARSHYDLPLILESYRTLYNKLMAERDKSCA